MRKLVLALAAASLTIPAALPAPAMARPGTDHGQAWHGQNGRGQNGRAQDARAYCRKPSGTTGLILGAGAGVLVGREIDKNGDRTTGTVLGAALGALLGRHVERNVVGRCR
ncbi:MAG: hypothetical protein QOH81_1631 [Sphingomonadales bacterium]|jgi:hypothetical protein|nr:hypothetical protein [Sphingomonadales bacterium]